MSPDSAAQPPHIGRATKIAGGSRWVPAILALLLFLGAAARTWYAVERVAAPDFDHPAVDAAFHDSWARSLAGLEQPTAGLRELETRPYLRPPGYPFFLAGVYALTGGSRLAAVVLQMVLGLVAGLLAFRVGRRWFDPSIGLVAAALALLNWTQIYFEGELHAPALVIVLLLGSLDLLGRWWSSGGRWPIFCAGLLLGLAALVRPNVLLFVVAVAAWMAWGTGRSELRRVAAAVLVLWLGVVTAVGPVTVRNARVAGDPVLISSNGGVNLYIGNHERATGQVAAHLPGLGRFETCYDYPRIVERVERRVGRELSDSEVSAWFVRQALDFARAQPATVVALTLHKARLFWGPREVPHNKELSLERAHSDVLRRLPGPFPLTALLACAGLCAALVGGTSRARAGPTSEALSTQRRGAALLALCSGALFLSVLPFFAAARYRVPLIPVLSVLEAVALVALVRSLRARRWSQVAWLVGCGIAAGALFTWGASGPGPNESKWHLDRARALRRSGDEGSAADEARQALLTRPADLEAHFLLGNALAASGDPESAARHYRRALEARPGDHRVLNNLGSVLAQRGDLDGALLAFEGALARDPDPAPVHYNLGLVLERAGRRRRAAAQFEHALELRPGWAKARRALARVRDLPSDVEQATLPR